VVLPYRGDMPARKRPAPEDTVTARRVLLDGLARDADLFELVSEPAPLHPRDNTFPGEVFLHLAADALDLCGASRADPLSLEGVRERFLPECTFRGRRTRSSSTQCWPQQPERHWWTLAHRSGPPPPISGDGIRDGTPAGPFMGWSVIEAEDSNAAVRLMQDHPFISRGGILQLSEPV